MRETKHSIQLFTPFGAGYIPEDHGHDPPLDHSKGWGRWPMALVAVLLCATTAAAAVMATGRTHAPVPALWKQGAPNIFTKAPDGAG